LELNGDGEEDGDSNGDGNEDGDGKGDGDVEGHGNEERETEIAERDQGNICIFVNPPLHATNWEEYTVFGGFSTYV
jgi:hypothetical protein